MLIKPDNFAFIVNIPVLIIFYLNLPEYSLICFNFSFIFFHMFGVWVRVRVRVGPPGEVQRRVAVAVAQVHRGTLGEDEPD